MFFSNYSDATQGDYKVNSDNVLEIYGEYCNRNFGCFGVDLTGYKTAVIEWNNQNTCNTVGCVISKNKINFDVNSDIASSNGIVKYEYNSSSSTFTTTTFDITDLQGTYYVGVFGFEYGFYGYIKSVTLYE